MTKRCTNQECRSDEKGRRRYCRGLCRACYMRYWRNEKRLQNEGRESGIELTRAKLQSYGHRNVVILRRREVQRMLDLGKDEVEIIIAFGQREELLPLLATCNGDPEKALKRDIAEFAKQDRDKGTAQRITERHIRQIREQLTDDEIPIKERTRLLERLHKLERESFAEARHVPRETNGTPQASGPSFT